MKHLITLSKKLIEANAHLPFSVYSSMKEQRIANVPVIKPLLIFILEGVKKLGEHGTSVCPAGTFVFLSNHPNIDMRNIPGDEEYFAILLEFEYSDFTQFNRQQKNTKKYFQGDIDSHLEMFLKHYIEWSSFAAKETLHYRRKELLQLLYLAGHKGVSTIAEPPSTSHQIYEIIHSNISGDWSGERLASCLSMSESTLRRKLRSEQTSVQEIKNRTKLGFGLHLVQTTMDPIGRIAEHCGYQSQSRFTDQFKLLFGMTPTELRKTKMND